jgi:predicted esterase
MIEDLQINHLSVQRTARYFTSPKPEDCREVVLALHGYAQHAGQFGSEVAPVLQPYQWLVVPEGLSRFYRRGVRGEVVASWMTREDRIYEIEDQFGYLDSLLAQVQLESPDATLTVLAFSQGVATACRWLARWQGHVSRLLLWAGTPPEDVWMQSLAAKLWHPSQVVVGDHDPYISEDGLTELLSRLDRLAFPYQLRRFSGGHQLEAALLCQLLAQDHNGEG